MLDTQDNKLPKRDAVVYSASTNPSSIHSHSFIVKFGSMPPLGRWGELYSTAREHFRHSNGPPQLFSLGNVLLACILFKSKSEYSIARSLAISHPRTGSDLTALSLTIRNGLLRMCSSMAVPGGPRPGRGIWRTPLPPWRPDEGAIRPPSHPGVEQPLPVHTGPRMPWGRRDRQAGDDPELAPRFRWTAHLRLIMNYD